MADVAVKVSSGLYKAIKKMSEDSGLSVRKIADELVNYGLEKATEIGKREAKNNSDLFDDVQEELRKLKKSNFELQTRLADLEDSEFIEDDSEDEGVELTKEDLLKKPKRPLKPITEEGKNNGKSYFCKECEREGRHTELDPENDPANCPVCGRKVDWANVDTEYSGGFGWAIFGVLAALAVGASRTTVNRM